MNQKRHTCQPSSKMKKLQEKFVNFHGDSSPNTNINNNNKIKSKTRKKKKKKSTLSPRLDIFKNKPKTPTIIKQRKDFQFFKNSNSTEQQQPKTPTFEMMSKRKKNVFSLYKKDKDKDEDEDEDDDDDDDDDEEEEEKRHERTETFIMKSRERNRKYEKKKQFIISEFIKTEEEYVGHLKTIKKYLFDNIKSENPPVMSDTLFSKLFGDFGMIIPINDAFLKEIKECENDRNLTKFSNIVIKFSQCFKLYSTYISKYEENLKLIIKVKEENERFKFFLFYIERKFKKKNFRITDFSGYLILPVQRIPRYRLLLDSILKETSKVADNMAKRSEYLKLKSALNEISKIADYCNNASKNQVLGEKMKALTSVLNIENLIQPWRKLLKEEDCCKCIIDGKIDKMTSCCSYLFSDIFVCLIIHKLPIKRIKFQTVCFGLKKSIKSSKYRSKDGKKISKKKGSKKKQFVYGFVIKSKSEIHIKIFLQEEKKMIEWIEAINDRIYTLENANIKRDYVIKPKTPVFASKFSVDDSSKAGGILSRLRS